MSNLLNSSNLDTRRGMVARTSFVDITICISPRDYVNRTNYDIFKIIQDIVAENRLKRVHVCFFFFDKRRKNQIKFSL